MTSFVKINFELNPETNEPEVKSFGEFYSCLPNWKCADGERVGELVDVDYMISQDIYPIEIISDSTKSNLVYDEILPNIEDCVIDLENKKVIREKIYNLKSSDAMNYTVDQKINEIRNTKVFRNLNYVFPNNINGQIAIRSMDDISLINSRVIDARERIIDGDVDSTIIFRDVENRNHVLTPQEMIELGKFVKTKIDEVYTRSWELKNDIQDICNNITLTDEQKAAEITNYFNSVILNWS